MTGERYGELADSVVEQTLAMAAPLGPAMDGLDSGEAEPEEAEMIREALLADLAQFPRGFERRMREHVIDRTKPEFARSALSYLERSRSHEGADAQLIVRQLADLREAFAAWRGRPAGTRRGRRALRSAQDHLLHLMWRRGTHRLDPKRTRELARSMSRTAIERLREEIEACQTVALDVDDRLRDGVYRRARFPHRQGDPYSARTRAALRKQRASDLARASLGAQTLERMLAVEDPVGRIMAIPWGRKWELTQQ